MGAHPQARTARAHRKLQTGGVLRNYLLVRVLCAAATFWSWRQWAVCMVSTREAYKSAPFAGHTPALRAKIFERIARRYDELRFKLTTADPVPGLDRNGHRRGRNKEAYDWLRLGTSGMHMCRVEAKSASLVWDTSAKRWKIHFTRLNFDAFDQLVLIVYLPWGLDLWEYSPIKACGKYMGIHGIQICSAGGLDDFNSSWKEHLRVKLVACADHVATLDWEHPAVCNMTLYSTPLAKAYEGVPFADAAKRHAYFENAARKHEHQHRHFAIVLPVHLDHTVKHRRGRYQQQCDWLRLSPHPDAEPTVRRVEFKSSMLQWDSHMECWLLRFKNIKFWCFDVLVLGVYAPWGLELWECRGVPHRWISSSGIGTRRHGYAFRVNGKRSDRVLSSSWKFHIRPKLQRIADHSDTLGWDHPLLGRKPEG